MGMLEHISKKIALQQEANQKNLFQQDRATGRIPGRAAARAAGQAAGRAAFQDELN
jgi:hypothetical protein